VYGVLQRMSTHPTPPDRLNRIVEETGGRLFGVEEAEVMARRKYVVYVRNQIEVQ
jgi:hypothetical protein